ncbi:MAG: peptide ABC transporter substrate-binding protein [Tumebacillaceae bacterium]
MSIQKKWLGIGLAVTLLSTTALVGCTSSKNNADNGDKSTKEEQTLNLSNPDDLPTLDMAKATDNIAFTMASQVNEGLLRLDADGKVVPGVAEKWETSADGLTWTFHLRDNAKWSDGSAVTAQDFEYAWKRTLDPKTASQYAFMVAWVKGGDAYNKKNGTADQVMVKAKDDKTLEVVLEHPVPFFAEQLSFPVFFPEKQAFVEKQGDKFGSDADKALYNGPFKVSSWEHEQSVEIVKNDSYWDKANVKLDKAVFQVVKDANSQENLYQTGALDEFTLLREQIDRFKDTKEYQTVASLVTGYVLFNEKEKAFQNAKIRQALTYAIDADKYADVIYHNGTTGATAFVGTGVSNGQGGEFRKDNGDLIDRKDNASKAKDLLKQGLAEAGLSSFPKMKLTMYDDDSSKKGAEFITEQWRQNLGIDVEIENIPKKLVLSRLTKRDYQMSLITWGADYNDPMTYLDMWTTKGDFNSVDYSNPNYDALINKAKAETDAKKRMQYMADAEKILMTDMPIGPVYFRAKAVAVKPYFKGFTPRVFGPDFDLKYSYVEGKK